MSDLCSKCKKECVENCDCWCHSPLWVAEDPPYQNIVAYKYQRKEQGNKYQLGDIETLRHLLKETMQLTKKHFPKNSAMAIELKHAHNHLKEAMAILRNS